jgi:acid phosphatase type 7
MRAFPLPLAVFVLLTQACSEKSPSTGPSARVAAASQRVGSVSVSPSTATVGVGQTVQITATVFDKQGRPISGQTVVWTSSQSAVATVSATGLVTGVAAGVATVKATAGGKSGSSTITVSGSTPPPNSAVLVGAGDIANCSSSGDEATAALLDNISGTVFTAGDNAYPDGTAAQFTNCYQPSWGRHKARTRPSAGNHDYHTSGASAYYSYFGAAAGDPTKGYYSYDVGAWHIIALNSEVDIGANGAQVAWLKADLAAHANACVLAYWHRARFSSGITHGSNANYQPFWQALYDANADVVISGHDHDYERFAPQTPTGASDPARGIREFVVGTGGSNLRGFATPQPNSEFRYSSSFGVLKLALSATSYNWSFIAAGGTVKDSGSGNCH